MDNFIKNKRGDFIAPDGNFAFEPTGVINIYVQGLIPKKYIKTITDAAVYFLGEIDVKAKLKSINTFADQIENL